MNNELKNCPFCGGEAQLTYENGYEDVWFAAACLGSGNSCGARGQWFGSYEADYKDKAIAAWNTRHNAPVTQDAEDIIVSTMRFAYLKENEQLQKENQILSGALIEIAKRDKYQHPDPLISTYLGVFGKIAQDALTESKEQQG